MTLLQSLKAKLQELDNRFSDDIAYRSAFSTVLSAALAAMKLGAGDWLSGLET